MPHPDRKDPNLPQYLAVSHFPSRRRFICERKCTLNKVIRIALFFSLLGVVALAVLPVSSAATGRSPGVLPGSGDLRCVLNPRLLAYWTAIVTPEGLCAVPIVSVTGMAAPVAVPSGTVRLICMSPTNPGAEAA